MPTCRACGAEVLWGTTDTGKRMPLDVVPTLSGNVEYGAVTGQVRVVGKVQIGDKLRYVSHFATCPVGEQFRRKA